jgi:integrase/recombinase XerC
VNVSGSRSCRYRPRDVGASGATAKDRIGVAGNANLPIADQAIPLALAARTLREAMKDKTYQRTPLGTMVRRYIRWLRNEYGATPATIRDYEAILARMSLTLADKEPIDVQTEDLRDVIDLWAEREARTRQKVTSVIRAFWAWMEEQGLIALSPAARIRRPRAPRKIGMRREELAGIQIRNFDADGRWVRVFGKGQKERRLPLRGPALAELQLMLTVDLPHLGRPPEPDDYLLYPVRRLANGKGPEGQMTYIRRAEPKKRPSPQAVHRWWYRLAQQAGLVGRGVTQGLNMHRARHLFAMELRRVAGIDAASQALGHSDLSTTLGIYGHRDDTDLEHAMDAYVRWLREQGL